MIFAFSAKSLPNQKNVAMRRAGTSKWKPLTPKTAPQGAKMIPRSSKMKPKNARMAPQSVPMAAQTGPGSPTCCSKCSRTRILVSLGASGTDFGNPGGVIWKDLTSILSTMFHSIPFHSFPFHSIPFRSIACGCIPFPSIRFHSIAISLHAFPGFQAFRIPESDASEILTCWFPDLEPPIGLGGMREA